MQSINSFSLSDGAAEATTRSRLLLEYDEEISRLFEYTEMYRRRSKVRLLPQDSIDFITTVLDQSEALIGLNRSLVPQEPAFTSVYTKTTTHGNPRPILTAYDLKKFHGFKNQVTDLVVIEGIRDVHAILLNFAENETAEAFAHAAFGLEFGAPYIQTTAQIDGTEYYVISFLFNDEAMKLSSVRETYSFVKKFMEAYPDLNHISMTLDDNNLCQIYLDKQKILATAEAYKNGRPLPNTATSGFSLLGSYAFQQEGWNEIPEQMTSAESIVATLERMQLDMIPTYNRLLKEGLEVLHDDRSFLPQTELEYIREQLDVMIWELLMPGFSHGSNELEKMYTLLTSHASIDADTIKEIVQAREAAEKNRKQINFLRKQFGKIVPRLSALRSIALGSEYFQAVQELEKMYQTLSSDKKRELRFILELEGFGAKADIRHLPRIVGFNGLLKIILSVVSQKAYKLQRDMNTTYVHCLFSPSIHESEGHINIVSYFTGKEATKDSLTALNDPLFSVLNTRSNVDAAIKQLQQIFCHIYKVELTSDGQVNTENIKRIQSLIKIGNLSERSDDLKDKKGMFIEVNLPAFGRPDDFKRKQ
jgi:hypothetical protein